MLQLINFAHSEVFMYGTFAVVWVVLLLRRASPASAPARWSGCCCSPLLAAMLVSAGVALLLERVAYRPLRKRNAPKLVALISAIGASFVLAELMGLRDRIAAFVGLDDDLERYVRGAREQPLAAGRASRPRACSPSATTPSPTVDILVIVSALVMMVALDQFVRRTRLGPRHPGRRPGPGDGGADGRQPRPGHRS